MKYFSVTVLEGGADACLHHHVWDCATELQSTTHSAEVAKGFVDWAFAVEPGAIFSHQMGWVVTVLDDQEHYDAD